MASISDNAKSPISTHSSASVDELAQEVLRAVVSVLRHCGMSDDDVRTCFQMALEAGAQLPIGEFSVRLGGLQRDCMEAMCTWRRDPAFLAENGLPAKLVMQGEERSFELLCRRANLQAPPYELLRTLMHFGAVSQLSDGSLQAETPTFLLGEAKAGGAVAIDGVLRQLGGFARAIEYNVKQALEGKRRRFERSCTVIVPTETVPVFERLVRERGQTFVDVLDEWLERHVHETSPSGVYVEIGAGAYFVDLGTIENK